MDKRVLTPIQLLDYKLIAIKVLEEPTLVEFYYVRRLTGPSNAYFSDGFCFVNTQGEFENRFPFFHEVFSPNSCDIMHFTKLFPLQHDAQSALE